MGTYPGNDHSRLRSAPLDSPNTLWPQGKLAPRLAAGGDANALTTAVTALKLFRVAYREAWKRFKELGEAVFPGGTVLMRKRFDVPTGRRRHEPVRRRRTQTKAAAKKSGNVVS